MKQEIPQDWTFYFSKMEGIATSNRVNLGLREVAPMKEYPVCTGIGVEMKSPGEHGIGDEAEGERIYKIEDELDAILEDKPCVMAGVVRGDGYIDFCYYSSEDFDLKGFVEGNCKELKDAEVDFLVEKDPDWENYFDGLYPDEYEMHDISNRSICRNLEEVGDDGSAERNVDFWIYFREEKVAKDFVEEAKEMGYEEVKCEIRERDEDEEGEDEDVWVVQLAKNTDVLLDTINGLCWELVDLAEEFDGDFDGWETVIVE